MTPSRTLATIVFEDLEDRLISPIELLTNLADDGSLTALDLARVNDVRERLTVALEGAKVLLAEWRGR